VISTLFHAPEPAKKYIKDVEGGSWSMPIDASTFGDPIDTLYLFIVAIDVLFFALIVATMVYFAWKYRRRTKFQKTSSITHNGKIEFLWSAIPAVLLIVIFLWGEIDYMKMSVPPGDAIDIRIKGQKWFWTVTYPDHPGVILTDEIIVPEGRPVRLTMTSEDVIHSFYIPAFRVKKDAVPGRYTNIWFQATRVGEYNLFCTEYCGDDHSGMIGVAKVLPWDQFEKALEEAGRLAPNTGESMAGFGRRVFERRGCPVCHSVDGTRLVGPSFKGKYGSQEQLADGTSVTVDDNYIRKSLLEPNAQVVSGFTPQMPSFAGQLNDEQITALVEFIKSVK